MGSLSGGAADFLRSLTPSKSIYSQNSESAESSEESSSTTEALHRAAITATEGRYDFFRLVRELDQRQPNSPRTGCSVLPGQEIVRFTQEPELSFAAAALGQPTVRSDGKVAVPVRFLGLLGSDGPLPLRYTEYVRSRLLNNGDSTLAEFLNLFQHRMVSLFYRAWAVGQAEISCERQNDDYFGDVLAAFTGIYGSALRHKDRVQDEAKLHFSGLLAGSTRSPRGLELIIQKYFGLPVRVEEFRSGWYPIPEQYHCLLGGQQAALGELAVVGSVSWEVNLCFGLRIGPLALGSYEMLLPSGESFGRLRDWVELYAGLEVGCDLRLELQREEIPSVRLGEYGRLGWTSWLRNPEQKPGENPVVSFPLRGM